MYTQKKNTYYKIPCKQTLQQLKINQQKTKKKIKTHKKPHKLQNQNKREPEKQLSTKNTKKKTKYTVNQAVKTN